jgi:hypothetical protein
MSGHVVGADTSWRSIAWHDVVAPTILLVGVASGAIPGTLLAAVVAALLGNSELGG